MRLPETSRVPLLGSIIALSLLLVPAGPALAAQTCEAPPGTSGTDQYCETLPGGTGDGQSTGGPTAGRSFDPRTRSALERSGREGRGVLELPSAGATPAKRERTRTRVEPSGSPFGSIGSALESGSTAGQGFIWLLAAAALGLVGIAWLRYRRGAGA